MKYAQKARTTLDVEFKLFRRIGDIPSPGLRLRRMRSNSLLVSYLLSYKRGLLRASEHGAFLG